MKTAFLLIKWFYLIYLPFMFLGIIVALFQINVLHYNPARINEDFGAQFLLGYLAFMALIAFVIFLKYAKNEQLKNKG